MILLEEEDLTLEDVGVADLAQILIEVRNKDLTWPEEMSQIASTKLIRTQSSQGLYHGLYFYNFHCIEEGWHDHMLLSICLYVYIHPLQAL